MENVMNYDIILCLALKTSMLTFGLFRLFQTWSYVNLDFPERYMYTSFTYTHTYYIYIRRLNI